ncbi:hypothetical protein [Morganella morganii]|uniref:hypothetical protein n=1 Tax=Morganella morganii TaxID=582 RepID=UPI001BD9D162|nr:hypothetical protein [Morganella morganii]MBT0383906.1 hypothetical protein [Morganella morganii subsp. morganii]
MHSEDFATQLALYETGTAPSRTEAIKIFRQHRTRLKDWRILYADDSPDGPFPLRRCRFSETGFVSTLFTGHSLWILDDDVLSSSGPQMFKTGYGTYIDSNPAGYIRSLAYRENPSENLLGFCRSLSAYFSHDELAHINPYLYLWEAQRDRSLKTVNAIRETIAALLALPHLKRPLDAEWGKQYRMLYREQAEAEADQLLFPFYQEPDAGLAGALEQELDILECVLVRTKLIELSSKKSPQNKMNELMQFMHHELSAIMLRELFVCADILFHDNMTQMSRKLSGLDMKKDPFGLLRNCARDLHMLRHMERLTNSLYDRDDTAFYIPSFITFDRDIADIIQLTELRAIALHRTSGAVYPLCNTPLMSWLSERLGQKRFISAEHIFREKGFSTRAEGRRRVNVKSLLEEDKAKLAELISRRH